MNSLASDDMVKSLNGVSLSDTCPSIEIVDSMSQVTVGTGSATTVGLALIISELEPDTLSNRMFVQVPTARF